MKPSYLVVLASVGLVSISTASAASLGVAAQHLTQVRTCILSAYPGSAGDEIDAMVEQTRPNNNYGTSATMQVVTHNAVNIRTYVEFAVTSCSPAIPASATVLLANLRLYASAVPTATCRTEDIFPATTSWTEAGITWNNQPFGSGLNNPTSGWTTQIQIGATCTSNNVAGYVSGWTVTADVQNFVKGSAADDGWMIRDGTEGSGTAYTATYEAKDASSATEEPQLVITYEDEVH